MEYSGNIGQLSLGDPLPYLLPYLDVSYDEEAEEAKEAKEGKETQDAKEAKEAKEAEEAKEAKEANARKPRESCLAISGPF